MHVQWWNKTRDDESTTWIKAQSGLDFANFVSGFIKKEPQWFQELWRALQMYFSKLPITLIHGDCRLGNMFFLPAGKGQDGVSKQPRLAFGDWEAVRFLN